MIDPNVAAMSLELARLRRAVDEQQEEISRLSGLVRYHTKVLSAIGGVWSALAPDHESVQTVITDDPAVQAEIVVLRPRELRAARGSERLL